MPRESVVYGLSVLLIVVGLVIIVYGEYAGMRSILPAGGVAAMVGVAIITGSILRL